MVDATELKASYPPGMAVADAMMSAQAVLMRDVIRNPNSAFAGADKAKPRYEKLLDLHTRKRCITASAYCANYLDTKFSDLFPTIMLINGYSSVFDVDGEERKKSFSLRTNFENHTFCLTQDKNGRWRAFSPANHEAPTPVDKTEPVKQSPMTQIFESSDLRQLIHEVTIGMGGIWPLANTIQAAMSTGKYTKPFGRIRNGLSHLSLDIFSVDAKIASDPYKFNRYTIPVTI